MTAYPNTLSVSAKAHSQLAAKPIGAAEIAQAKSLADAQNAYARRGELDAFSDRVVSELGISTYPEWVGAMGAGLQKAAELDCSLPEIKMSRG